MGDKGARRRAGGESKRRPAGRRRRVESCGRAQTSCTPSGSRAQRRLGHLRSSVTTNVLPRPGRGAGCSPVGIRQRSRSGMIRACCSITVAARSSSSSEKSCAENCQVPTASATAAERSGGRSTVLRSHGARQSQLGPRTFEPSEGARGPSHLGAKVSPTLSGLQMPSIKPDTLRWTPTR